MSLSLCLSADLLNLFCTPFAFTLSSVRGNLFVNYRHDYGLIGLPLALFHLWLLRFFDRVIAMTAAMSRQIYRVSGFMPYVIGNFIDEPAYKGVYPVSTSGRGAFRFLFLGSLSSRKQPVLIVRALKELRDLGVDAFLTFIGAGPELPRIISLSNDLGLSDRIHIVGFVDNPEQFVIQSDVLVLPSLSEGVSRAAIEALFLGVPCVLRNVDGASELIVDGNNGVTFSRDSQLAYAMLSAAKLSRSLVYRQSLLPQEFRYAFATDQYVRLISAI